MPAAEAMFQVIVDTGLSVYVENEDISGWFNSSTVNDDVDYKGLSITKTNTTQLLVTFRSGTNTTIIQSNMNTTVTQSNISWLFCFF